jgi:hypothetical protein
VIHQLPDIREPFELMGEFNKLTLPMLLAEKGNVADSLSLRVSKSQWEWLNTTLCGTVSVMDYLKINSLMAITHKWRVNWVIGD